MPVLRTPLFTIETGLVNSFGSGTVRIYENFSGRTFEVPDWLFWAGLVGGAAIGSVAVYNVMKPAAIKSFTGSLMRGGKKLFKLPKIKMPKL